MPRFAHPSLSWHQSAISLVCVIGYWLGVNLHNTILAFFLSIIALFISGYFILQFILPSTTLKRYNGGIALPMGIFITFLVGLIQNIFVGLHLSFIPIVPIIYTILLLLGTYSILSSLKLSSIQKPTFSLSTILVVTLTVNILIIITGVIQLNNHISNVLSIIGVVCLLLHIIIVGQKLRHLPDRTIVFTLLLVAVGITIGIWLRSPTMIGVDANRELGLFNFISQLGYWSPSIYADAYNACLSITVFPQTIHLLTGLDGLSIYKLLIPIAGSTVPPLLYLIFRRFFTKSAAFYGTLIYVLQPVMFTGHAIPLRQQIAFMFFAAFLCMTFEPRIPSLRRKILATIFGIGLIVSHYSTGYVFIAILAVAEIIQLIRRKQIMAVRGRVIIILSVFMLIWYGMINVSLTNVTSYVQRSIQTLGKASGPEFQNQGSPLASIFGGRNAINFDTYLSYLKSKYGAENILTTEVIDVAAPPRRQNVLVFFSTYIIRTIATLLLPWLALFGIWHMRRSKKSREQYALFYLTSISTLVLIGLSLMPAISADYSVSRLTQQLLIIIAPAVIMGISYLLQLIRITRSSQQLAVLSAYTIAIGLVNSGLTTQYLGGGSVDMRFNNDGLDFARYSNSTSETTGWQWLADTIGAKDMIVTDIYTGHRSLGYVNPNKSSQMSYDILNSNRPYRQVVLAGQTTLSQGAAITPYKGVALSYRAPVNLTSQKFNTIYASSGARIYRSN